jgi:hypothetical protein
MFVAQCPYGLFILSCFMLVEFSNVSLNAQVFLEQNGKGNTKYYAAALYTTFVGWIVFRIVNPIAMVVILHAKLFPGLPETSRWCLIPGAICAYLINVFCIGVFVFILCKEVRLRWRKAPLLEEIAPHDEESCPVDVENPRVPLTQEEKQLTLESPTRMLILEAREKFRELEEAAEKRTPNEILVTGDRGRLVSMTVSMATLENRSSRLSPKLQEM